MKRLLRVAAPLVLLGATSVMSFTSTAAAQSDAQVAAVGRIVLIETHHGFVVAEFPNGRMWVSMDKRQMGQYIIGDELRIDSFGRPLPPQPRK